jgi:hypothetical protein
MYDQVCFHLQLRCREVLKKEIDNKLSLFKTENLVALRFHFTTLCFFRRNVVYNYPLLAPGRGSQGKLRRNNVLLERRPAGGE